MLERVVEDSSWPLKLLHDCTEARACGQPVPQVTLEKGRSLCDLGM